MENAVSADVRLRGSEYGAAEIKIASLAAGVDGDISDAVIRRAADEYPMLLAPISATDIDPETGQTYRVIDFTPLRAPGRYFIDVPGVGRSEPFEIV